jgi:hypothetical protein
MGGELLPDRSEETPRRCDESEPRTRKTTAEDVAVAIVSSEPFMWLMVGANHVELHLDDLRKGYAAYIAAGGKTWGRP